MIPYRATMSVWSPLATADPLAGSGIGTVAVALGALALAGTGKAAAQATAAIALRTLGLAGTGLVAARGTQSATFDALTMAGSGTVRVGGALAATLDGLGLVATGTVVNSIIHGTLSATLDALTTAGAGAVLVQGGLSATLGRLSLAGLAIGAPISRGSLSATFGALSLAGSGHITTLPRAGTVNVTLGPVLLAGIGWVLAAPTYWPHEWCPALGPTRTSALAVDVVQFGDGYGHRATRGLNPVRPTMGYDFPFVNLAHLGQMNTFLKTNGARGFVFQPPDEPAPIWVCCNDWSATLIDRTGGGEVVGKLTTVFARAFNPQPTNVVP